ncbi:MAG: hypothetical protein PUD88_03250, partial [Prevotellaceae bacterium]|nr:hypothetical protein [Prevotellaceae bacterium]
NGEVTNYTLHGKNVVHMTQGSNELHFFYDASNKPAIVEYNGTKYAYVHNLQGDIVAILDQSGNVVVQYTYDAWGRPISKIGTLANTLGTIQPFRYRGYVYDEETGLYYLRSRYYAPHWCRFTNADSVIVANLFVYCDNSPIILSDACGTSPQISFLPVCIRYDDNCHVPTLGEYIISIIPPDVKAREISIVEALLMIPNTGTKEADDFSVISLGFYTYSSSQYAHRDVYPVQINFEDNGHQETLGTYINRNVPSEVNEPTMVIWRIYNKTLDAGAVNSLNSVVDCIVWNGVRGKPTSLKAALTVASVGFVIGVMRGFYLAVKDELN